MEMNRNRLLKIAYIALATFAGTTFMKAENNGLPAEGYIGRSEIRIQDGRMTPEALLGGACARFAKPRDR